MGVHTGFLTAKCRARATQATGACGSFAHTSPTEDGEGEGMGERGGVRGRGARPPRQSGCKPGSVLPLLPMAPSPPPLSHSGDSPHPVPALPRGAPERPAAPPATLPHFSLLSRTALAATQESSQSSESLNTEKQRPSA